MDLQFRLTKSDKQEEAVQQKCASSETLHDTKREITSVMEILQRNREYQISIQQQNTYQRQEKGDLKDCLKDK